MANAKLKQRVEAAAHTLTRLPRSHKDRPGRSQSGWPDMQRTARLCVDGTRTSPTPVPSPAAIDDMFVVVDPLYLLPVAARRLLWARACGLPWVQLQLRLGGSRTHLNRRYRLALAALAVRLDPLTFTDAPAGASEPLSPESLAFPLSHGATVIDGRGRRRK